MGCWVNGLVVVDASVVVKWLIKEEDSRIAVFALKSWTNRGTRICAPYFMLAEVTNALHRQVRKGSLSLDVALGLLDYVLTLEIELHETSRIHHRALELASHLDQGAAYDSHYLALAESLGCDLWTADQRLHRTAGPLSPNVHWLGDLVS